MADVRSRNAYYLLYVYVTLGHTSRHNVMVPTETAMASTTKALHEEFKTFPLLFCETVTATQTS